MIARILIAGVIGGIVMFVWGAVTHLTLPSQTFGVNLLQNDQPVMDAMQQSIFEPGMYAFPGIATGSESDPAALELWTERSKAGPVGVIMYKPGGTTPMSPMQLGIELVTNILAALLGAFIAQRIVKGFGRRFLILTLLGPIAWLTVNASYWNWYHFPTDFTVAALVDETLTWMVTAIAISIVLAWKTKPKPEAQPAD